jgi:hypothetical protein
LKKWQEEFYKGKDFLRSFGLKLSILQSKIKLYLKHGISKSLMLVILKYLTVLFMLLFLLKVEISLMRKGRNLSLLAIMMNKKAFDFSILKRISYFFPKMLFLWISSLEMGRYSQSRISNTGVTWSSKAA